MSTPKLSTVVRHGVEDVIEQLYTAIPAVVVNYNPTQGWCTADPMVADHEGRQLPRCERVPVAHLRWGGFAISAPLAEGDLVLLLCADRSIDELLAGGGPSTPNDPRRHDLSDAIALPQFSTFADPVPNLSATDLRIGNATGGIDITPTGEVRIKVGAFDLVAELHDMLVQFQSTTVQTLMGPQPFDPATQVKLAAVITALKAIGADV